MFMRGKYFHFGTEWGVFRVLRWEAARCGEWFGLMFIGVKLGFEILEIFGKMWHGIEFGQCL